MILHIVVDGKLHYLDTLPEMLATVNEIIGRTGAESDDFGEDMQLMFSNRRHAGSGVDWPDNLLRVAASGSTGYGGLIWSVSRKHPVKGGIFDHVWVSDNPAPPDFDPRVVSDPGAPRFHDPRSVLPLAQVREAVEEFCRTGTGMRPESVRWVRGQLSGERLE